jgi:hypothetical protein
MRRRTLAILGFVVLLILAVAIVVLLRRNAPPEAARLLPEADAVLYINVDILRRGGVFAKMKASPEPEYQDFIRQTGFQFERDLDEAAFAVHATPPTPEPRTPATDYPRFSEVFIGKFDTGRGAAYFGKLARTTEQYRDATIFNVPHEGRTVRVALLGPTIVAVSNTESPDAIHSVIDRYRRVALPFSGPTLLGDYYKRVPFGSIVWLIGRIAPTGRAAAADGSQGGLTSPAWLRDVAGATTLVASLRFIGVLQLRLEDFAATAERAHNIAENGSAFLAIFRGAESNLQVSGNDPDVKAALRSIQLEQNNTSVVLKADVPVGLLKKLASDAAEMSSMPSAEPPTQPVPAPVAPSRKRK